MPGPSLGGLVLNPDFRDLLSAFIDAGVEFLVVGAYAMAAHRLPRATKDLDLWVRPSADNAGRVLGALDGLDVPVIGRAHLVRNKRTVGRPQDLLDADLLESQL